MKTLPKSNRILIVFLTLFGLIGYVNNVSGQCSPCTFGTADGSLDVNLGGDVDGTRAGAVGYNAAAFGIASFAMGTASAGTETTDADRAFAIGDKAFSYGDNSFTLGHWVEADASQTFNYVFGSGTTSDNLINDISNSIMIGMDSDESTMFI
jgi:hypothetical protein